MCVWGGGGGRGGRCVEQSVIGGAHGGFRVWPSCWWGRHGPCSGGRVQPTSVKLLPVPVKVSSGLGGSSNLS